MNKNKVITKLFLILALFAISISSFSSDKAEEKNNFRINFDGSVLVNNDGQLFLPYGLAFDFGRYVHPNLCLNAGVEYWSTTQDVRWTNGSSFDYYWNGEMINLIFNGSLQFISPSINLKSGYKIAGFVEPGLSFEPFPIALINYEKYDYYYSTLLTADNGIEPYLSWNMKVGAQFINEENMYLDIAYCFSNMDLYKVYRDMKIDNYSINGIVPNNSKYKGLRVTLGVKF